VQIRSVRAWRGRRYQRGAHRLAASVHGDTATAIRVLVTV